MKFVISILSISLVLCNDLFCQDIKSITFSPEYGLTINKIEFTPEIVQPLFSAWNLTPGELPIEKIIPNVEAEPKMLQHCQILLHVSRGFDRNSNFGFRRVADIKK